MSSYYRLEQTTAVSSPGVDRKNLDMIASLRSKLALAACCLALLYGAEVRAQPVSYEETVRVGEAVLLNGHDTSFGRARGCQSTPTDVTVAAKPKGGATFSRIEHSIATATSGNGECNGAVKNVRMVYYKSRLGFAGRDQVQLLWFDQFGRQTFEIHNIHVLPGDGAPQSVQIAAPAARPRMVTPTAKPDASRKNASDFFLGIGGAPAPTKQSAAPASDADAFVSKETIKATPPQVGFPPQPAAVNASPSAGGHGL